MFFGSDRAFVERIPKAYRNLSDIAMQMDDENKQMQLVLVGLPGNENAPSKTKKTKIKVNNFRNYDNEEIELNKNINIFYGENAQGKTNIIESIFLASIGKSFRSSKDSELIKFGENYAKLT